MDVADDMIENGLRFLAEQSPQDHKNLEDSFNFIFEDIDKFFVGSISAIIKEAATRK